MAGENLKIKNFTTADVTKKPFDAQNTSVDNVVKELIKDKFQVNTIEGTIFYSAVITEVIKNYAASDSFISSLFGLEKLIVSYRVYVPEVHSGLGKPVFLEKPQNTKDLEAIKKYAIESQKAKSFPIALPFFPSETNTQNYAVGDAVWVLFQNARTLENGFIFGKITQNNMADLGTSNLELKSQTGVMHPPATYENGASNPERYPAGMQQNNFRWLLDFSAIVDMMASSKGYPYRYGMFPQVYSPKYREANWEMMKACYYSSKDLQYLLNLTEDEWKEYNDEYPNNSWNTDFGKLIGGQDCASFVKKAIVFLDFLTDEGKKKLEKSSYDSFVTDGLGSYIDAPHQLPGDVCILAKTKGGRGHAAMVVSYPIPAAKNHSLVWGSQGGGHMTDGIVPHGCIGCGLEISERNIFNFRYDKLFNPITPLFWADIYPSITYFRFNAGYVKPSYVTRFANNGNVTPKPDQATNKAEYLKTIKDTNVAWARQYSYPAEVDKHSPVVISAPDLFRTQREQIIDIAKKIHSGVTPDAKDYIGLRIKYALDSGVISTGEE